MSRFVWVTSFLLCSLYHIASPLQCPAHFCLQSHEENPGHGDVCRKCAILDHGGGGPWTCPIGCARARGNVAPFCVVDQMTSAPCRAKVKKNNQQNNNQNNNRLKNANGIFSNSPNNNQRNRKRINQKVEEESKDECDAILTTIRSGEYLRMAPCAPKRQFSDQKLVPQSSDHEARVALGIGTFGKAVRFYLIDDDAYDDEEEDEEDEDEARRRRRQLHNGDMNNPFQLSDEMVQCYFNAIGGDKDFDNIDDLISPRAAEHFGDYRFLKLLQNHPMRTLDPNRASVFIIGYPTHLSYLVGNVPKSKCGGLQSHYTRMDLLSNAIEKHPLFTRRNGEDFLLFLTHYDTKRILGPKLHGVLEYGPIILASADREFHPGNFFDSGLSVAKLAQDRAKLFKRSVAVPLKAHFLLDEAAEHRPDGYLSNRSISLYFNGNMKGGRRKESADSHDGEAHFRERALLPLAPMFTTSQVHNIDVGSIKTGFKRLGRTSVQGYISSQFCMVPVGDTPISRRLYEALASGCIPIVMGTFENIADSLPFRASVDWSEIAIFAGDLECLAEHMKTGTKHWLAGLIDDDSFNERRLSCMRRRGQVAFAKYFSFRKNGGLVEALLMELDDSNKLISPTHIPPELIAKLRVLKPNLNNHAQYQQKLEQQRQKQYMKQLNPFLTAAVSSGTPEWQQELTKSEGQALLAAQQYDQEHHAQQQQQHGVWSGNGYVNAIDSNPFIMKNQMLLSNKEKAENMAMIERAKLTKTLLEMEGFSLQGTFNHYQGDTQLIALRHHSSLSRPFLFCSLPMSGGGSFEAFLIKLTPKKLKHHHHHHHDKQEQTKALHSNKFQIDKLEDKEEDEEGFGIEYDIPDFHFHLDEDHEPPPPSSSSSKHKKAKHESSQTFTLLHTPTLDHHKHKHHHHHHHNHHHLDFVGLKPGLSPWSEEGKDWGDIATVFGTHTKPPFYKAAVVRDPVTRLLAVLLTYCHSKHEMTGLAWERCNPPALHKESSTTTGVTAQSIQRIMNSTDKTELTSLEEFIERLEAGVKPFQEPLLRQQIDQCGFRFARYDVIARFERLVSDSLKLAKVSGISHLLDQLPPSKSGENTKQWREKMIRHEFAHGLAVSDVVCDYYNQDLLERTFRLYQDDFVYFGYNITVWTETCQGVWSGFDSKKMMTKEKSLVQQPLKRKKGWTIF